MAMVDTNLIAGLPKRADAETRRVLHQAWRTLRNRVSGFVNLTIATLADMSL